VLIRIRFLDPSKIGEMTAREWLDQNVSDERLRQTIEALMRLATYTDALSGRRARRIDAAQHRDARRALRRRRMAEARRRAAQQCRDVGRELHHQLARRSRRSCGAVRGIELGELELDLRNDTLFCRAAAAIRGRRAGNAHPADNVLLAVDPSTARSLAGHDVINTEYEPVTATCLDVALSRLPSEKNLFALGIDRPHLRLGALEMGAAHAEKAARSYTSAKYRKERAPINDDEIEIDARDKRAEVSSRRAGTGDAAR